MIIIITYYIYIIFANKFHKRKCKIKNLVKRKMKNVWKSGNYIDLGCNDGDSLVWFYNIYMPNLKYTVLYPKIMLNFTKSFNTYIFEANPYLCNKIYKVVDYIKKTTKLTKFNIYCPVIVSTYDGLEVMTIDKEDVASSKYYSSNMKYNKNRKNFTLPVMNITNFILDNIPSNDFNVMKIDVEGEEHFIMPELIKEDVLTKFDIIYSEFHNNDINNPLKEKGINNYYNFINYTQKHGIEIYEELKVTENQMLHHLDTYNELISCRKGIYT